MQTMNAHTRIATPAGMALLGLAAAEQWSDLEDAAERDDGPLLVRARDELGWVATAMLRRAVIGGGP